MADNSSTAASIARNAACYCFSDQQSRAVMIYLLRTMANSNLTPSELASAAKCFCFDERTAMSVQNYLLNSIVSVSGGGQVLQGHGDPVAPPSVPASPAIYTNLDSGVLFTWNVDTQTWI